MLESYIVAGWLILVWPAFWLWIGSKLASKNFSTMAAISLASLAGFSVGMTMLANVIPQTVKGLKFVPVYSSTAGTIYSAQAVTSFSIWHYLIMSIPWIIIAFVVARLLLGFYVLRSRVRGFGRIDEKTQRHFDRIAKLIGINPVKVYYGSTLPVAFSDHTGVYIGKPIISGLPKEDVDAIIAHEYSHIKRKDVPSHWLWLLMTSIAFVMPSRSLTRSYLLEVEKNADREAVTVLGSPLPLAQALVSVARISSPVAANFGGSDVTERAMALLEPPKQQQNTKRYLQMAVLFSLSLLLPAFTWPQPVIPNFPGVSEQDMHRLVEGKALAMISPTKCPQKPVKVKLYPSEAIKMLPDGRVILDRRYIIGTL
jgi:beta-lactamase regulating signal transducer with metallopeptidase domain